jgi:high-affinity nickel permease
MAQAKSKGLLEAIYRLLLAGFLLGLFFDTEDGSEVFLLNLG